MDANKTLLILAEPPHEDRIKTWPNPWPTSECTPRVKLMAEQTSPVISPQDSLNSRIKKGFRNHGVIQLPQNHPVTRDDLVT